MQANARVVSGEVSSLRQDIIKLIEGVFTRKLGDAVGEDLRGSGHLKNMLFMHMMALEFDIDRLMDAVEANSEHYAGKAVSYSRGYAQGVEEGKQIVKDAELLRAERVPAE